ncbi:MAG: YihY/virulence factor BrkB family protein [Pseudonocardiaceae bacterium]|nr:YihY/virulence factor BrkB family protein [Pseudonocardiaceae bacterium]
MLIGAMSTQDSAATGGEQPRGARNPEPERPRRGPLRLLGRTMSKAWEGNLFSEAAEAAFWQTLSLPPLLLGLLGSLGYVAEWFGSEIVRAVREKIMAFSETIFSQDVVDRIIEPTVNDILTVGRGEIVSVGFLISLWAGSSALSSFVDAITVAHGQYGVRNEVWQRIVALLLYMATLVLLIVGLPIIALGPDLLPDVFPTAWQPTIATWVGYLYYPTIGGITLIALATLYKLALPHKLPWHRVLPGAIIAMIVFLLTSVGLRLYIAWITTTGYTYGALATPIAWLLFAFFIGLAVVIGAYFNAALEEMWPAKMTRRQRRRWRRLEVARADEPGELAEAEGEPTRQDEHAAPRKQDEHAARQHQDEGAAPTTKLPKRSPGKQTPPQLGNGRPSGIGVTPRQPDAD